jgi:hypothetical protein
VIYAVFSALPSPHPSSVQIPQPIMAVANLLSCLIKHHAMNTYGGGDRAPRITSTPDGDEGQLHTPSPWGKEADESAV